MPYDACDDEYVCQYVEEDDERPNQRDFIGFVVIFTALLSKSF
jgi:hypothetical protein